MYVAVEKVVGSFRNECAFREADGIGEHQLKYVTSCFNVYAKAKGVMIWRIIHPRQVVIILPGKRHAWCKFEAASHTNSKLCILFEILIDQILMNDGRHELE